MRVGCISAGTMAGLFGRYLLNAGHTIIVSNSRGPETLADLGATAGTKQQAVECDVVILAVTR